MSMRTTTGHKPETTKGAQSKLKTKSPTSAKSSRRPGIQNISKRLNPRGGLQLRKTEITRRLNFYTERSRLILQHDVMDHTSKQLPPTPQQCGSTIFLDFIGPVSPVGFRGEKFAITLVDVLSRWSIVACFPHKDDITSWFALWWHQMHTRNIRVGTLVCDVDNVLVKGNFAQLAVTLGISIIPINTESQWQDLAEPWQRWLKRSARAALIRAGLSRKYWPLAYEYAAYTKNRTWVPRIDCTPYELWLQSGPPDVSHMRVFGQHGLVLKRDKAKQDDGPFAAVCVLARIVAYAQNGHGYHFLHDQNSMPFQSQHVVWLLSSPEGLYLPGDARAMSFESIKHQLSTRNAFFGLDNEQQIFLDRILRQDPSDISMANPPIQLVRPPGREQKPILSTEEKLTIQANKKAAARARDKNSKAAINIIKAVRPLPDVPPAAVEHFRPSSQEMKELRQHTKMVLDPKLADDVIADTIAEDLQNTFRQQPAPSVSNGVKGSSKKMITYNMVPTSKMRYELFHPGDHFADPKNPNAVTYMTKTDIGNRILLPDGFDPFSKTEDPQEVMVLWTSSMMLNSPNSSR